MRVNPYKLSCRWNDDSFLCLKYRGMILDANISGLKTHRARPCAKNPTMSAFPSSLTSDSMRCRRSGKSSVTPPRETICPLPGGSGSKRYDASLHTISLLLLDLMACVSCSQLFPTCSWGDRWG